jgi:hypothetical protein
MSNAYTSTETLASLKRRGMIPTSAQTLTTAEFYKIVDEETQTYIVPLLLETREEYLVAYTDVSVTASTTSVFIPERAIGGKLRDVSASDGSNSYRSLTRFEPERVDSNSTSLGGLGGYYLEGNKIVFVGTPPSTTLRVTYYQRPNRVVATTAVGEVTAIAGNTITIAAAPSTFLTTVTYDFVKGKPGFDTLGKDFAVSAAGTSMVFTSTVPTDLAVGDYICLSQETPIPQIPVELHPLLAQRVAATVLQALGDPKAQGTYQVAADMEKRILKVLQPRTDGSARVIVNKYGVGRGSRNRRGY